jgi:hypothetical protein
LLKSGAPRGGVERFARRRGQAAAKSPGRAAKGEVCDRRKPDLVGPQGKQEVSDAIRRGQVGIRDPDAVTVDATTTRAHEHGSRLTDDPRAQPGPLDDQPGSALELPRIVTEEISK